MPLFLVPDPSDCAALFGVTAAQVARRLGARLLHTRADFDLGRDADACQHVFSAGGLGPSGLFFAERILGGPVGPTMTIESIVQAAAHGPVVVPVHGAFGQRLEALSAAAERAGVDWEVVESEPNATASVFPEVGAVAGGLRIALIGREHDHRAVCPAGVVSLQEAADAEGIALDVVFADPAKLATGACGDLDAVDGLLLPGGSDMANVPGQLVAARHAIEHGLPALGLCLGMQTMATAFARAVAGQADVNLAEADPDAPRASFEAMADAGDGGPPLPVHRTGDQVVEIRPGSDLARLMVSTFMTVRCNHRYRLAPALRPSLEAARLAISAQSAAGRIADAIEWPDHPFYLGLQGHPELGRPAGSPHPVFAAFLQAAQTRSTKRKRNSSTWNLD